MANSPPLAGGFGAAADAATSTPPRALGELHPEPLRAAGGLRVDRLDWPARGLSTRSRRVARAAAEAMLCDENDAGELVPARAELCERAVAALDHSVGRGSSELRRGYAVLCLLLELLPVFVIGSLRRMTQLSLERRLQYLEALESSRIGLLAMLFVAFKIPLCIPAFEEGAELAATGFDRPSTSARRRRPALEAAS